MIPRCPSEKLDPDRIIVEFHARTGHKSKIQWNSKTLGVIKPMTANGGWHLFCR